MPLNELEQHPYLNYFINYHEGTEHVPWNKYTRMIIGSFPIYELTDTLFPKQEYRSQGKNDLNFFYGSKSNSFWQRLSLTLAPGFPLIGKNSMQRKLERIELLESHGCILSDVIKCTNRFKDGDDYAPDDSALLNNNAERDVKAMFALNLDIVDWVFNAKNLDSIYFTAQKSQTGRNPGGWFHEILKSSGVIYSLLSENSNSLRYNITNKKREITKEVTLYFLPTPSASRSIALGRKRQLKMFVNYIRSINPTLLNDVINQSYDTNKSQAREISKYRSDFISLWWRKYLIDKAYDFDGSEYFEKVID